MAHAVKELFPEAKLAIGPAIDDGFYYDFDLDRTLAPEDLIVIEKKMSEIIKQNHPFVRRVVPKKEAVDLFRDKGEEYKVELLEDIPDEEVSLYEEGGFIDLCRGPHLDSTGQVAAFKLLSVAGAYWRGNEKNKMLQRIYGTSFTKKEDLKKSPRFSRGGQKKGPQETREGTRPVQHERRNRSGPHSMASQRCVNTKDDRGFLAERTLQGRLQDSLHAAHRKTQFMAEERPPRFLPGEYVFSHGD